VIGWILVGLSFHILLIATSKWHRYWPYSWSIFTEAWSDIVTYMTFNLPPLLPGEPLDAVQKLAYAGVVFLLTPFQILTGARHHLVGQAPVPDAREIRHCRKAPSPDRAHHGRRSGPAPAVQARRYFLVRSVRSASVRGPDPASDDGKP
jgi:Prokaryotic cytochrome b561